MNSEELLIWKDVTTNHSIFSITEIEQSSNSRRQSHITIDIFFEALGVQEEVVLNSLFDDFLKKKTKLVITVEKKNDFRQFFKKYKITEEMFFYKLIVSLNSELSERKFITDSNKEIIIEMRNYSSHERPLSQALEEYYKQVTLGKGKSRGKGIGSLKSVSFQFSHLKKPYKIEKQIVLSSIMNCLMLNYRYASSVNFDIFNQFKKSIINTLFDYFRSLNSYWYAKNDSAAYRIIEDIFSLTDFDYSFDAIRKSHQRITD